jgi:PHD/YefM family antitoxin component YafN of YafNO toxin-antitoxin module
LTISLNPQYVIDRQKNPKAVLLTIDEWNQIVEALEELDDIRSYDAAKTGDQESIPFEQAVREIQEDYKA